MVSSPPTGGRFNKRSATTDHWRRSESDPGRPYVFKDAATLIDDFFDAVERVLTARGAPFERVAAKEGEGR